MENEENGAPIPRSTSVKKGSSGSEAPKMAPASSSPLTVRLFGPLEIRLRGEPLPLLRSRKGQWLLALLALHAGRELDRAWLAGLLWPDSSLSAGLANLRNTLVDLRRTLAADAWLLRCDRPRILCLCPTDVQSDVAAFDAAIRRGSRVPLRGYSALEQAISLYRGPLLDGCSETWAIQERASREEAFLAALEALAARALAVGDPVTAARYLRQAVGTDPLRETAQRSLMQALAEAGNHAAAFQVYGELRRLLHREMNALPDPETEVLFRQIQVDARLPNGERPRRGGPSSAATGVAAPSASPCHNLPFPATRFIGREREIREIRRLLRTTRLLTATGAGGCGKTRLALEAAHGFCREMPEGVWLVELASLADPALLPQAVATALGVRERPGESLTNTLVGTLKKKRSLLFLDNCEHLLTACVALVDTLLRGCPGLRVLATSREALGMLGETTYRVPGLSLPVAGFSFNQPSITLLRSEAVRLYLDRATAVEPSFELTAQNAGAVVHICRRLDGIPLALEMAAARVRAMPVETLAERIGDCFRLLTDGNRAALPRHRTLRAMIEWSHDLLSEPERALLRRLSVFAGGWTLEAAEAVCGDDERRMTNDERPASDGTSDVGRNLLSWVVGREAVLDLLTALVDKSLVVYENRGGEGRYRLLETIRQFAQECLAESFEVETTRRRHAEYFLLLAETLEPHLGWTPGLDRLGPEVDNLRAVLAWATERGGLPTGSEALTIGLRLAGAVRHFWRVRGYATERREWLATLLSLTEGDVPGRAPVPTAVLAKAVRAAGQLAWVEGDGNASRVLLQRGLDLAQETGDRDQITRSLLSLGLVALSLGEREVAQQCSEESLVIFRELDNQPNIAILYSNLGLIAREQGDYERARSLLEESLRIFRELGDRADVGHPLARLGTVRMMQGDYAEARVSLEKSLAISQEAGDQSQVACALDHLGTLARYQGDLETARARHAEALRLHHTLGNRGDLMHCLVGLGCVAVMRGESAAPAGGVGNADFARETRLFGVAEALREATGWVIWSHDRPDYERCVAIARSGLGETAFAAAWAEGRRMILEQACDLVLDKGQE